MGVEAEREELETRLYSGSIWICPRNNFSMLYTYKQQMLSVLLLAPPNTFLLRRQEAMSLLIRKPGPGLGR